MTRHILTIQNDAGEFRDVIVEADSAAEAATLWTAEQRQPNEWIADLSAIERALLARVVALERVVRRDHTELRSLAFSQRLARHTKRPA